MCFLDDSFILGKWIFFYANSFTKNVVSFIGRHLVDLQPFQSARSCPTPPVWQAINTQISRFLGSPLALEYVFIHSSFCELICVQQLFCSRLCSWARAPSEIKQSHISASWSLYCLGQSSFPPLLTTLVSIRFCWGRRDYSLYLLVYGFSIVILKHLKIYPASWCFSWGVSQHILSVMLLEAVTYFIFQTQ